MHFSGFFYLLDRRGSFANENPFFFFEEEEIDC